MRRLLLRWRASGKARHDLVYLMSHISPQRPIRERLVWLIELLQWARAPTPTLSGAIDFNSGQGQSLRVRYLLQSLERNPEWKLRAAQTLRSILRDTHALDLFSQVGMPNESSLLSEAVERFLFKFLPQAPHENDLGEIFPSLFPTGADAQWLDKISHETLSDIGELLNFEIQPSEKEWNTLQRDMEDALLLLISELRATGLSPSIRKRISPRGTLREIPFYQLSYFSYTFLQVNNSTDSRELREKNLRDYLATVESCRASLAVAYTHLGEFGVSLKIVYQLDRLAALLGRVQTLAKLLATPDSDPVVFQKFLAQLVVESSERHSLSALFGQSFSLISKKIAERSAETGEHYITRSRREYWRLYRSAAGGGVLTALTALLKVGLEQIHAPYFMKGVFASMNYAGSFVVMQLCGATLGTKQPAMTASALAAKMKDLDLEKSMDELVTEVVHLIRSQICAILGNVGLVIPVSILISLGWSFLFNRQIVDPVTARNILDDHSIFGPSIWYASFTGVLLWISSVCAGWIDNWFAYREIPDAIAHNRRLHFFIGPSRSRDFGAYLRKNIAAFSGNISLGILLGMGPKVATFLGLPLDVRHVTLASGTVSFAVTSLGVAALRTTAFWQSVVGIVFIGAMNLGVSFALALMVAIRARKVEAPNRRALYRAVFKKFLRNPFAFVFPVGVKPAPALK